MNSFEERKKIAQERKKSRLDICLQCEHLNQETYICALCGCAMKQKTGFIASTCPINKW